jgi:lycopene beta-cyclase
MLGRATYLALMAACLLVTLPLELVLKAGVYRRPRRWLAALLPVFLAFSLWDWVAIHRGHWTYSPRYTTGITYLTLPLEELVFFLVVPTCALLTYQAVTRLLPPRPRPGRPEQPPP